MCAVLDSQGLDFAQGIGDGPMSVLMAIDAALAQSEVDIRLMTDDAAGNCSGLDQALKVHDCMHAVKESAETILEVISSKQRPA